MWKDGFKNRAPSRYINVEPAASRPSFSRPFNSLWSHIASAMSSGQLSPSTMGMPGDFDHPNEELRRSVKIALVFAFTLSTVAVALRILARKITGSKLFLDDYLILIALVWTHYGSTNSSYRNVTDPSR